MKRTLPALLLLALPFGTGAHAAAALRGCVAVVAQSSCTFSCAGANSVTITVGGPGFVQGSATCGNASASCSGTQTCTRSAFTGVGGTGTCVLTSGAYAVCVSTPSD